MTSTLKRNPFSLSKLIKNKIAAGRIKSPPVWYHAMNLYPMAPIYQHQLPDLESTQQELKMVQIANSNTSFRRKSKLDRNFIKEIVYPEDEIRSAFYRWHPLELKRPVIGMESLEYMDRDWSTIFGGNSSAVLTGENVVQHTLYLMNNKGMDKSKAYETALHEFYKYRAEQEKKAMDLEEELQKETVDQEEQNEKRVQTYNTPFVQAERKHLLQGKEFTRAKDEAREMKRTLRENMSAFERREDSN